MYTEKVNEVIQIAESSLPNDEKIQAVEAEGYETEEHDSLKGINPGTVRISNKFYKVTLFNFQGRTGTEYVCALVPK